MSRLFKYFVLAVSVGFSGQLFAQKRMLDMDQAASPSGAAALAPKIIPAMAWIPNSKSYTYIANKSMVRVNASGNVEDTLISINNINQQIKKEGYSPLTSLVFSSWLNKDKIIFSTNDSKNSLINYFTYDPYNRSLQKVNSIPMDAENADQDHSSMAVAYTKDNNLYICRANGVKEQITKDEDKGIVNGQATHRREFGIVKGTFWSPKGTMLAFYRADERNVTDYGIMELNDRPAKTKSVKYPMAGMKSHEATIGIYNTLSKNTIFLKTGEPAEQYLTNISWSPDEKYVFVAVLNRDQNHMWLNKYDAQTGDFIKTLFEEKQDKYVEPLDPLLFVDMHPDQFLYLSQRDGWKHFYLYDINGNLLKEEGKGEWGITQVLHFDPKGKFLYFMATAPGTLGRDQQLYRLELANAKISQVSSGEGMHSALVSTDCEYVIDRYSSLNVPREINLLNGKGKLIRKLLSAPNPLADFDMGTTKLFSMNAVDGTPLSCRMIYPPHFDSAQKYPVVIYVYGGPHAQMINNSWLGGSNLWMQLMAQKGYIVFTMDNRGSGNRGLAFEQVTFRSLGTHELEDQMRGVDYLKGLRYVDSTRLGVHGWSFGGFMTTSLMTRYPGVFKAAVAGGPVIDWKYYEIMYTERYMDTPQQNPEGYDKANLLNYVNNLNGHLLLIHGTSDDVVLWQHSLMYLKACVDKGKQVDYFVYPGHQHNVTGNDRVHLMNKVTRYFDDFLK